MSTLNYILACALVFAIQSIILHFGFRSGRQRPADEDKGLYRTEEERKSLLLLPVFGSVIFALIFVLILFQFRPSTEDLSAGTGLLYGVTVGLLVYAPQSLYFVATLANVGRLFARCAIAGLLASALSGLAVSFII